jgi:hypothetical protein
MPRPKESLRAIPRTNIRQRCSGGLLRNLNDASKIDSPRSISMLYSWLDVALGALGHQASMPLHIFLAPECISVATTLGMKRWHTSRRSRQGPLLETDALKRALRRRTATSLKALHNIIAYSSFRHQSCSTIISTKAAVRRYLPDVFLPVLLRRNTILSVIVAFGIGLTKARAPSVPSFHPQFLPQDVSSNCTM